MAELAPIPHRHWPTPGEILKQIAESARGTAKWVGHHKRGALLFGTILTGTGGAIIYAVNPAFNQTVNSLPTEAAAWWNSMLRGSGSGSSVVIPETATATPKPIPTETKLTPTIEAQKPKTTIIINGQPTPAEILPPFQVQQMVDEVKKEGTEFNLPLPDILQQQGMGLKEIHRTTNQTVLAITAEKEGEYMLPALTGGKIVQLIVGGNSNFSGIAIDSDENFGWGYSVPNPKSSSLFKEGDIVTAGQSVISFTWQRGNTAWETGLETAYTDAPLNTIATISIRTAVKPGEKVKQLHLTTEQMLTTPQGFPVLVGPAGKG